jgi:tetratricopeptide (TPR) repeat protein
MSVLPREQLSSAVNNDEFRNKTLLQIAVTVAIALLNGGKGQEAVSQIVQYADIAAQSCVGCYVFGLIHFNAGKLRDALSWLNRALALQPAFVDALSARAVVHQRLGQPQEALKSFEAVLKLRPGR